MTNPEEPKPLIAVIPAPPPALQGGLTMGTARSPDGREITVNSRSLLRDGLPWLPVMGEFHYARTPEGEWRDELLKVQAGGIDIVASYQFWIHHEEQEGRWDWSGRRSLRRFVQLCGEVGLAFVARIGPWCHGEVRNGGLPDWLLAASETRTDDPRYLTHVRRFYAEIAAQLQGLLWKDGGPVVGVQIENEYGGPAEHLLTLKRLAREAGLDVPLYTRTGWPELSTPMPLGELLPLFGGYPDGFWDRSLEEMPPGFRGAFRFSAVRADAAIATDQLGDRDAQEEDNLHYPYFACEIGGGMERSYHRRIRMAPADIAALALVKLGSGSNLQGYYMYHGGTNPEGRLSTLQESQATGYWNDLPVKSYDFQAPLGEFGQVRAHYHSLRRMHLFLRDFGAGLALMPSVLPERRPAPPDDTDTLRWSVRSDGRGGFLFVNNYQRLQSMPPKEGVQFDLRLPTGPLVVPNQPVTLPADCALFWPFNLDMGGAALVYATAQLVCRLEDQGTDYSVFAQTPGVPSEFVFDAVGLSVESANGEVTEAAGRTRVELQPGTEAALRLRTADGRHVAVLLLDEPQSLACWKGVFAGRERLFLTRAALLLDGDDSSLRLRAADPADLTVGIFPAPPPLTTGGVPAPALPDGLFHRFTAHAVPAVSVEATWEQIKAAGPARRIVLGSQGVAEAPSEADFEDAAVWRLHLPSDMGTDRALRLRIHYTGDVARVLLDDVLLTDNFYNGDPLEVGLKRHAPDIYAGDLRLQILPLRSDAPIHLPQDAWPDGNADSMASLHSIEVVEELETEFRSP